MLSFFKNLFGVPKHSPQMPSRQKRDPARYEQEKKIAQSRDKARRMSLAKNTKTHQEILYFMAEHDPDAEIRKTVAENTSTPLQASPVLATDMSADVRMALASRLVELLPSLSEDKQSQLYAFAVQALGTLALDEVLRIRKALSSTLKDHAHTPPKIAAQLARDVEREVAEPILMFCAALEDEALLDILKEHPESWAVQAIAGRESVSEPVSDAVIETDDTEAGSILLRNEGAAIGTDTLKTIVEKAKEKPEWQEPAALRKNLPPEMAQKLAAFAQESVKNHLLRRKDFDAETIEEITQVFERRLKYDREDGDAPDEADAETAENRARRLAKEGRLTEETIADALGMRDKAFVYAALAGLVKTTPGTVEEIFSLNAPKPIVALCWKAGLSMRMALQLQKEPGQVRPKDLIYPRDGTDYPLTRDELLWQLDFVGLEAA